MIFKIVYLIKYIFRILTQHRAITKWLLLAAAMSGARHLIVKSRGFWLNQLPCTIRTSSQRSCNHRVGCLFLNLITQGFLDEKGESWLPLLDPLGCWTGLTLKCYGRQPLPWEELLIGNIDCKLKRKLPV